MIFKKKEFFLLIFLIFLQSCSGGRIGNFLESSFNDLEKTSQNEDLQNNLVNKKTVVKEIKEIDDKKNDDDALIIMMLYVVMLLLLLNCSNQLQSSMFNNVLCKNSR